MKAKKIVLSVLVIAIIGSMSGCVYSNNKNWNDLSAKEQQEVQQELKDAREEIEEELPNQISDFALGIFDKVADVITS